MSSQRQHYVPRFYLKSFESAPRRLHLYNLKMSQPIANVSLRDQCRRHNFYGSEGEAEKLLAATENEWDRIVTSIKRDRRLPRSDSSDERLMFLFVAAQALRTKKTSDQYARALANIGERIVKYGTRLGEQLSIHDVNTVLGEPESPGMMALPLSLRVRDYISDLNAHLVISERPNFITSDNPVFRYNQLFRYNQFCEDSRMIGAIGAKKKGLQIFVPISPNICLILYDGSIYKVSGSGAVTRSSCVSKDDVKSLNFIRLVSAGDNIYFSNWNQRQYIGASFEKAKMLRDIETDHICQFVNDEDEREVLTGLAESVPNLSLDLRCLRVRRKALRIPVEDLQRLFRSRHAVRTGRDRDSAGVGGRFVKYSRLREDRAE